jgi:lipopolysaccharide/colanic/teichoic acid biosynthesis glycosyltransferase
MSYKGKRSLDIIGSLAGLAIAAPLLGAIAIAVRISMGSPVLFRQRRPGFRGQPFDLYKFRTMRQSRYDSEADAERITGIGKFLRSSSLDELPELVNVVAGDMSLVGPRPLLMQYLERYSEEQARRHEVLPGITGWAQINGRNAIDWDERFKYDVWYVDNSSLLLDLKILAKTILNVLRREGISHPGEATMHEFLGSVGDHSA